MLRVHRGAWSFANCGITAVNLARSETRAPKQPLTRAIKTLLSLRMTGSLSMCVCVATAKPYWYIIACYLSQWMLISIMGMSLQGFHASTDLTRQLTLSVTTRYLHLDGDMQSTHCQRMMFFFLLKLAQKYHPSNGDGLESPKMALKLTQLKTKEGKKDE